MNVLSLFDGISCGRVALERAGIPVTNYFASEIHKPSIKIAQKNYSDTIQIGSVVDVNPVDLPVIDLVIGGSPCQGFSFAGDQLAFEDTRSKLYFEYLRIWNNVKKQNPKAYFLLENVRMKEESENVISEHLGYFPHMINSSLFSAQSRERLYWTNINFNTKIVDKGILLKDIMLNDEEYAYQFPHGCSVGGVRKLDKSPALTEQFHNNYFPVVYSNQYGGRSFIEKSPTLTVSDGGGGNTPYFVKEDLLLSEKAMEYMSRQVKNGRTHWDFGHHSDVRNPKSQTVVANFLKGIPYNVLKDWDCIRKFHPIECERLQTLSDNYTEGVSNTNRYRALGNGWTVDVIAHIFKGIGNGYREPNFYKELEIQFEY